MTSARALFLVLLLAAIAWPGAYASAAPDRQPAAKNTGQQTRARKPVRAQRPRVQTGCEAFGAGFARLPGSDSCIRFGGGVGMGVGAVP